jgi:hypothetical protein
VDGARRDNGSAAQARPIRVPKGVGKPATAGTLPGVHGSPRLSAQAAMMATLIRLVFVAIVVAGCASAPMPDTARGPSGERLPDLCYQWTFSGMTKALTCHPAPVSDTKGTTR